MADFFNVKVSSWDEMKYVAEGEYCNCRNNWQLALS